MKSRRSRRLAMAAAVLTAAAAFTTPHVAAADAPAERGPAALASAATAVEEADIPGTAWGVDPATKTLRVSADTTVDTAGLSTLHRATARYGDAVTVERIPGTLRPHVSGGSTVFSDSWSCTAGFNVHGGGEHYLLTAGHCTAGASGWYADAGRSTYIGPTVGSSFPGNDYGLVRYENPSLPHPSDVRSGSGMTMAIRGAGNPYLGQEVCTTNDRISYLYCGTVTGLNVTVNYGGGDVLYGMAQTNLCSEPGMSGAPVFSGTTAVGILSGGSGNCSSGGTTFFQPIVEALQAYGLNAG